MCEGDSCRAQDIPTGSAAEFDDDAMPRPDRKKQLDISTSSPPVSAIKKDEPKPVAQPRRARSTHKAPGDQAEMHQAIGATNLPRYYQGVDRSGASASDRVVYVPKSSDPRLKGLKSGDVVWAVVEQEITASPSVPTPVRATATSGQYKGALFVGEATLDHELKRVLFSFNKLRLKSLDAAYTLKAAGLSPRGSIGLEGEYYSQAGKFFIAELASAAAAGYLDSTINRNQTALGTYVQEPSLVNSGKTAAVSALSKTAERAAEGARNAPEYTRVPGYQEIQVIIQDDPIESGS